MALVRSAAAALGYSTFMPRMIRMGDITTHGGVVIEGAVNALAAGPPVATVGHNVACPLCKGVFPIVQGNPTHVVANRPVAYEGHVTACGARLISLQGSVHHASDAPLPGGGLCAECLIKAAIAGASTVTRE